MDLMLTSFGLSHLERRDTSSADIFYRMPPASLARTGQQFLPDYAALLIADRILLDETTYERLISGRHYSYGNVSLVAKTLFDEGFVRLENFDQTIQSNRARLEATLNQDLEQIESWTPALEESISRWRENTARFSGHLEDDYFREDLSPWVSAWLHMAHGRNYWMADPTFHTHFDQTERAREELKQVLSEYLAYVNANLLLASELDASFHDWSDFQPFYKEKFVRGRIIPGADTKIEQVNKLFTLSFPEFTFWKPSTIVRALKDSRIADLRRLVDEAAAGEVQFDREFAVRTLTEVLRTERSIGKIRNIISYATLPLDLIPIVGMPVQKVVEEMVGHGISHKKKKAHRWFYLISEMAEHAQSEQS